MIPAKVLLVVFMLDGTPYASTHPMESMPACEDLIRILEKQNFKAECLLEIDDIKSDKLTVHIGQSK